MGIFNFSQKKHKILGKFKFSPIILSVLLILLGAVLLFVASFDSIASNSINEKYALETIGKVRAEKIIIPALNRTLNINDGFVSGDRWTVSETGVSHLSTSAVPGSKGNAVLYGHNRDEIMGKLWKVQSEDYIYVLLSDGSIATYQIFERKEVKPNQVEILNNVGDSRLTIYTCSGFLDSARFVVVGELVS